MGGSEEKLADPLVYMQRARDSAGCAGHQDLKGKGPWVLLIQNLYGERSLSSYVLVYAHTRFWVYRSDP